MPTSSEYNQAGETMLRVSEVLDALPAAVYMTDAQGRLTMFNQAAVDFAGRVPQIGEDMWGITEKLFRLDGTRISREEYPLAVALKTKKPVKGVEVIAERPDGSRVTFLPYPTPLFDTNGTLIGAINMLVDITKRRKAEEALRKSEERYMLAENATNDGLWDWNTATGVTYLSPRWKALLGFSGKEVHNHIDSFFNSVHPEEREGFHRALDDHLKTNRPFNIELRLQHKDGGYRWFRARGQVLRNDKGEPFRMVGSIRNINYRKEKEELLRFSERRYRRIFEAAQDGIIMVDPDTYRITDANPYIINLLSRNKEELVDRYLDEVGIFKNKDDYDRIFKELEENSYIYIDDTVIETPTGQRHIECVGHQYNEGDLYVIQFNIRDVSERKRAEAIKETEILLKSEKIRTEFIADATHEFRTPLAIIKGNVDLGLKGHKTAQSALKAVEVEVKHLSDLLSDLSMLITKDTQSEREITRENVHIPALIERAVERCETLARKKNIALVIGLIPDATIRGDLLYMEKLLINIINNAIIYGNEDGHVWIDAVQGTDTITISIRDDGIGIPLEELPQIFERFFRTTRAREGKNAGTGLGLAISKWVVEAHGGTIEATSGETGGSTFTITFPLAR